MLILELLGRIRIRRADGEPAEASLQPRRLALLAYLAVEARPVTRSELVALLWPDTDERRARASLNQLLHTLRRRLGTDLFRTQAHDTIEIAPGHVRCDVLEFTRLVDAERYADAVALWTGELLPGFGVAGADPFERWLDGRRESLRLLLCDAALRAAATAAPAGDRLTLMEKAAAANPFHERLLRRRLELLAESGDHAGAAAVYEQFRARLAAELDARPSAETNRLFANITRQHADDSAANASPIPLLATASSIPPIDTAAARVRTAGPRRWAWLAAAAVLVVLGIAVHVLGRTVYAEAEALRLYVQPATGGLTPAELHSIDALLPGALGAERLPLALTTRPEHADYIARISLIGTTAGTVGALHIVDGSGRVLRSAPLAAPPDATPASLARLVSDQLLLELQHLPAASSELKLMFAAERLIRRARAHADAGAFDNAEHTLQRVEETLARAHDADAVEVRLLASQVHDRRGWNAVATGALPAAAAHFMAGTDALRGDTRGTEHSPDVQERLGALHYYRWMVADDDALLLLDTATNHLQRSLALDSERASAWLQLSHVQFAAGRYAESLGAARQAQRLTPAAGEDLQLAVRLFLAAFNAHVDSQAQAECTRIRGMAPHTWPAVACAGLLFGWSSQAGYAAPELAREVDALEDPAPIRAATQAWLHALIDAAAARRGVPLDDDFDTAVVAHLDLLAFRTAQARARGMPEADTLRHALASTAAGRRVMRMYARVFDG